MRPVTIPVLMTLFLVCFAPSVFSIEQVQNFRSVVTMNDVIVRGSTVWMASSGGLFITGRAAEDTVLQKKEYAFPDVNLVALEKDRDNRLWVGSEQGFVYRIPDQGPAEVYSSLNAAEWRINDMFAYEDYLIIGSDKGCYVFDPYKKQSVVQSATRFGNFSTAIVYKVYVHKDTLYLGCAEGVAKLNISGNNLWTKNFKDPSIWAIDTTIQPARGFRLDGGSVTASSLLSREFGGAEFTSLGDTLIVGTDTNAVFGEVTCFYSDGNEYLWIGTRDHYAYRIGFGAVTQFTAPGPTFTAMRRVYVDQDGDLWYLPTISKDLPQPWWQGVGLKNSSGWRTFNGTNADPRYPTFAVNYGSLGGSPNFDGIVQQNDGTMWFGSPGGHIKTYNKVTNTWVKYNINNGDQSAFYEYTVPAGFGLSEAIAQDSAGYMWIANWNNTAGCLICYDPRYAPDTTKTNPLEKHYARYFPQVSGEPYFTSIYRLQVDNSGNIFAGAEQLNKEGALLIFRPEGNPLTGARTVRYWEKGFEHVSDFYTLESGITLIATGKGLLQFDPQSGDVSAVDSTLRSIKAIEAESENILWLGTQDNGLIKFNTIDKVKEYFSADDGLVSDNVIDLAVDKGKGQLWVATENGLSRCRLGHSFKKVTTYTDVFAYPNPYSLGKNRRGAITFKNLRKNSVVTIYDMSGTLVTVLTARTSQKTSFNEVITWDVPQKIVPGTYLWVAKLSDDGTIESTGGSSISENGRGKIFIIP